MPRGRGTLEVRQSSNPFYETTNSLYGDQDVQQKDLKDLVSSNTIAAHKPSEFSFLYSRTSDVYGKDPMKAKLDGFDYDSASANKASSAKDDLMRVKHTIDVESALKIYKHESIRQNPLYSTSASEIGKKAPTVATYVAERCHRAQSFSKSFNHMKPKSSSLNTGLTKSTIHPSLSPQFT